MPIKYELTLGESIEPDCELTFEGWVDEVWGKYHTEIVLFAVLSGPEGAGGAYTNGICALLEPADLQPGDKVTSATVLGTAAADGESVPYGKPYSVFKYNT